MSSNDFSLLLQRLDRIENALDELLRQRTVKDHYQIEEFADIVGKAPFTCREWAQLGRIHAEKKNSGRDLHAFVPAAESPAAA